jgi:general secretion pathway protein D
MRGQSIGIFPVQYSNPEPIITEFEKILDSGEGGLSQGNIKFQPMARMNGILAVTKKPDLLKATETWIKRLDTHDTNRTGVHVYRVNYGEARQVAKVLNDIFVTGGSSSSSFDTPTSTAPPSASERLSLGGSGQSGAGSSSGFGGGSSGGGLGSSRGDSGFTSTIGNANSGNATADEVIPYENAEHEGGRADDDAYRPMVSNSDYRTPRPAASVQRQPSRTRCAAQAPARQG